MDHNSMLYWWPLVKDLDIPMPTTRIVEMYLDMENFIKQYDAHAYRIYRAIQDVGGFPVFLRTDLLSGKHDWSRTCFYETGSGLLNNIRGLIEASDCAGVMGLPVNALVIRQYIEMDSRFRAFDGLPISRERRYFVWDGVVECHHSYWQKDAIKFYRQKENPARPWRIDLENLNYENDHEVELLTKYARALGSVLPGYWSVDFCHGRFAEPGKPAPWYFIDCALGEQSWHPECTQQTK